MGIDWIRRRTKSGKCMFACSFHSVRRRLSEQIRSDCDTLRTRWNWFDAVVVRSSSANLRNIQTHSPCTWSFSIIQTLFRFAVENGNLSRPEIRQSGTRCSDPRIFNFRFYEFYFASSLRYYTESIIVVTASTCRGIELLSTLSTLCSLHKPTIYVCIIIVVVLDVISSYSLVWGWMPS